MATEEERAAARSRSALKRQADEALTAKALNLRIAGASYEQIAQKLNIGIGTAHRRINKALTSARTEAADELLRLQNARLDMMLTAIAGATLQGDVFAQDRFLRIMQERNKLAGLYDRKIRDDQQTEATAMLAAMVQAAQDYALGVSATESVVDRADGGGASPADTEDLDGISRTTPPEPTDSVD